MICLEVLVSQRGCLHGTGDVLSFHSLFKEPVLSSVQSGPRQSKITLIFHTIFGGMALFWDLSTLPYAYVEDP